MNIVQNIRYNLNKHFYLNSIFKDILGATQLPSHLGYISQNFIMTFRAICHLIPDYLTCLTFCCPSNVYSTLATLTFWLFVNRAEPVAFTRTALALFSISNILPPGIYMYFLYSFASHTMWTGDNINFKSIYNCKRKKMWFWVFPLLRLYMAHKWRECFQFIHLIYTHTGRLRGQMEM